MLLPLGALLLGASPIASLELDIQKLRSAKGQLRICLTARAESFPDCKDARGMSRSVPATQTRIQFDGLPPGDYAAAIIHDENGNHKLDKLMGIPREGFGFSRNPVIRFGPPSFAAARFTLDGTTKPQQVRMQYLL
ncbi:DUF2141 domain-containing protein [Sphingomonas sp. MG17]|jgi:uncharacterized protein (DUF2141 family)|uniref:DUF2141 domain-containing protein n=1 Tax=Sphingomonas tagetis TaxID=2949092 RepID=A0A9X2HQ55_9SPHN|nr:DUF2141 domain-containing protein [Sphingomonas tagetis]MCP3732351.1 DUF2141 domain-containing protein [Sphingomonas tagetis]